MQGAAAVGGSVCGAHGGHDETYTMEAANLAFHDVLRSVVLGDILPQAVVLQVVCYLRVTESDVARTLCGLCVVLAQGTHGLLDLLGVHHLTGGNSGSGSGAAGILLGSTLENNIRAAGLKGLGGIFAHQGGGFGHNRVNADHADLIGHTHPVALLRHSSGHSGDGQGGAVRSYALGQGCRRDIKGVEAAEVDGVALVLRHGALLAVLQEGQVGQQPGQQGAVVKGFLFSGKITVSLGSSSHSFIHSLIF